MPSIGQITFSLFSRHYIQDTTHLTYLTLTYKLRWTPPTTSHIFFQGIARELCDIIDDSTKLPFPCKDYCPHVGTLRVPKHIVGMHIGMKWHVAKHGKMCSPPILECTLVPFGTIGTKFPTLLEHVF